MHGKWPKGCIVFLPLPQKYLQLGNTWGNSPIFSVIPTIVPHLYSEFQVWGVIAKNPFCSLSK